MPPESLVEAANAVAQETKSNSERVSDWVKDGTASAEPVTTETPTGEQPRDPATGKFLAKEAAASDATHTTEASASASASPAPSPGAAPAAGASATTVQEFIEAQLADGSPFKLPKGVRIPLKRGETVVYDPVEEVQKRGMLELDYRHKTAATAADRRALDQERTAFLAEQARIKAREDFLNEREAEMSEAQKDPEKWEAYQETLRLYQTNPRFAKLMDDALAKRETDAENAVYQEQQDRQVVQTATAAAASWIDQMATEFTGVNPDRVRARYAEALTAGRAALDPAHVRAIYQDEARYLTESTSPLQKQLADLTAEVTALKAGQAAEKHNANTSHALNRARTPQVAVAGQPPAPSAPAKTGSFGLNQLAERNAAWANQR